MASLDNSVSNTSPILISVNGNIGSGKSTYLALMKEKFENDPDVTFLDEPVKEWEQIQDDEGKNLIEKYYGDQKKYAFAFQINAFVTRFIKIKNAIMEKKAKFIVTERCLFTDKNIFAKMLAKNKTMEKVEYDIYKNFFDEFNTIMEKTAFVYIRTDPEVCAHRIKKRNRKGEDSVDIEYLKDCHENHEEWLLSREINQKLIIDGNANLDEEYEIINEKWIQVFQSFLDYFRTQPFTSRNVIYA